MSETAQRWPLSWPEGRPRTPASQRVGGAFSRREMVTNTFSSGASYTHAAKRELTNADATARLDRELALLAATRVVLSTNVELRRDGTPRADRRPPDDPGVALYFRLRDTPTVLACDRFTTVAANIAAIASHIDSMRKAERHGVGSLEQMFRGFTALPSSANVSDWRRELDEPRDLAEAERNYRDLMRVHHPDVGGSVAKAAALNAAIALARQAFAG
ncbi:MAG: J domain-containing protein [Candidatus Eremiobacteraeota bacterium]|nr:J domain-containing protein [Candidatus Eremiobacteraeota bacterium]